MRIGEMERDSLIAHGVTSFLQESMMKRSDGTEFVVCNGCGTIPIYNPSHKLYVCSLCDGPLTYQGNTVETLGLVLPVRKSRTTFSKVAIPYTLKLLDQEMTTFLNGGLRFLTEGGSRQFREPTEMTLEGLAEEALGAERKEAEEALTKPVPPPAEDAAAGPAADEDAPEDREDEGEPIKNVVVVQPVAPPGVETIKFYSKIPENREFSNFHPVKLLIDGLVYPTVEHYFQAMKFPDHPEYQEAIRRAKSAKLAKSMGKTEEYSMRPDWTTFRDTVMMKALREKFSDRHPELKEKLLATGSAILQEASPRDNYWGLGSKGTGQNKLGVMLMALRDELRGGLPAASMGGGGPQMFAADDMITRDKVVAEPVVTNNAPVVINMNTGGMAPQQQEGPMLKIVEVDASAAHGLPMQPQAGGGALAPAPFPVTAAFAPAPPPSNATTLGAQANTPPCNQVPSNGATAAPSVAPLPNVPLPATPQPIAEFKVLTLSGDLGGANSKK